MKPKLIFRGPLATASGYGVHSRQLLRALLSSKRFDVSVISTNWGQTSYILKGDPIFETISRLSVKHAEENARNVKYDISVQVTIPNEFQKLAGLNIGVTAGIEVDRVSPDWIVKANEMVDLVVVPSKHSLDTYATVRYQDRQGNFLQLQKSIALCPEGVDTTVFNLDPIDSVDQFRFEAPFNFLAVGLGLDRGMGEDRKNISTLVKWFCERFKGERDVGLILKAAIMGNSLLDFDAVSRRIDEIKRSTGCGEWPKIHLIHGRLADSQLAALYKHPRVKALVSLTHGEGFGLPLLEAAACGLPVLATNWSGHVDFLSITGRKRFVPVDYDLVEIPDSAVWKGVLEPGTHWANPKEEDAKSKMKKLQLSYEKPKEWALELAGHVATNYSLERTGQMFSDVVNSFWEKWTAANTTSPQSFASQVKKELAAPPGSKTLLYTMPMSAGDVYISTAVVDGLKKKHPDHLVYFATDERYSGILKNNPNIFKILKHETWMNDVPLCEKIFDQVYTPNLAIQTLQANWIRGGKGRRLADEMAAQCQVDLGDYWIQDEPLPFKLPERYVVFHPGSGKGQWEARNYLHWQDVVSNLVRLLKDVSIVHVGASDDRPYDGVVDIRGKTNYNQLAWVIGHSRAVVGIDSVTMHMAAGLEIPHVALFGSSYPGSTGPVTKIASESALSVLLETPDRYTCDKACYKYQCSVDKDHPCINEIDPGNVVGAISEIFHDEDKNLPYEYQETRPKIAGYTHTLDAETGGYPYVESIRSMLGFCDQVVVVDGGSTDGTVEKIRAIGDPRLKIYERKWDWAEPGMDGMQKAFGRAMCSVGPNDFLWQQDVDEVVHEADYEKIKKLVKRFPQDVDLIHLPVVELWGGPSKVRTDRHSWKWRLSRNNFRITHGINKLARVVDEKTGKTYAKKGMSDGCEYVDIMTGEFVPHKGFYSVELEDLRHSDPEEYGRRMNAIFEDIPSVYHYSWANIPRKIRNFKKFWNRCWSTLYNDSSPIDRFPDVDGDDDGSIMNKAEELLVRGGEHGAAPTFILRHENPSLMSDWISAIR